MINFLKSYALFALCMTVVVLGVGVLLNGLDQWDQALRDHWPLIAVMPVITIYLLRKLTMMMDEES